MRQASGPPRRTWSGALAAPTGKIPDPPVVRGNPEPPAATRMHRMTPPRRGAGQADGHTARRQPIPMAPR
ncbi:hypothetical protein LNKW23_32520 [Paralimibaculum aggregatum]|uniref:Uncharacterized protein n=1 Tax=Paralimibaculum aggregatum TaxID=3036245 RepID=A0ABQ6LRC2_9RHOB|nr:hypothetical protein LNKW23_32520 [Limibaculum sp. NKW23]